MSKIKLRPTLEKEDMPIISFYLTISDNRVILHGVSGGKDIKILRISGYDGWLYRYDDCHLPGIKTNDLGCIIQHDARLRQQD